MTSPNSRISPLPKSQMHRSCHQFLIVWENPRHETLRPCVGRSEVVIIVILSKSRCPSISHTYTQLDFHSTNIGNVLPCRAITKSHRVLQLDSAHQLNLEIPFNRILIIDCVEDFVNGQSCWGKGDQQTGRTLERFCL